MKPCTSNPILALFFFIEGLGKVPLTFFEAELLIDRAVVPEIVRNLCFAALAIGLALGGGYGIFSMLIAHVTAAADSSAAANRSATPNGPAAADRPGAVRIRIPSHPDDVVSGDLRPNMIARRRISTRNARAGAHG